MGKNSWTWTKIIGLILAVSGGVTMLLTISTDLNIAGIGAAVCLFGAWLGEWLKFSK